MAGKTKWPNREKPGRSPVTNAKLALVNEEAAVPGQKQALGRREESGSSEW